MGNAHPTNEHVRLSEIAHEGRHLFFTVVTYPRRKILVEDQSRLILRSVIEDVRRDYPFDINAWVLLPDHLHCIWTLPPADNDFSKRWGLIKAGFSKRAKPIFHRDDWLNPSKIRHRESTIWQRRFWEHEIRDDADFQQHMDYIHFNPVKHGLVSRVAEWPYSTFYRYVRRGVYPAGWGSVSEGFGNGCGEWMEE